MAALSLEKAERLQHRLAQEDGTNALHEAATLHVLAVTGLVVDLEPEIDGLTPDLACPTASPPILCEVHSRNLPAHLDSNDRRWQVLRRETKKIPAPYLLASLGADARDGSSPTSQQTKTISEVVDAMRVIASLEG